MNLFAQKQLGKSEFKSLSGVQNQSEPSFKEFDLLILYLFSPLAFNTMEQDSQLLLKYILR